MGLCLVDIGHWSKTQNMRKGLISRSCGLISQIKHHQHMRDVQVTLVYVPY